MDTWIGGVALLHHYFLDDGSVLLLEDLADEVYLVVDDVLESVKLLIRKLFFVQHQNTLIIEFNYPSQLLKGTKTRLK